MSISKVNLLSILANPTATDDCQNSPLLALAAQKAKSVDKCERIAFYWALSSCLLLSSLLADLGVAWCFIAAAVAFPGFIFLIRHLESRASAFTFMLVAPITAVVYLLAAIHFASAPPEPPPSGLSAIIAAKLPGVARARSNYETELYMLLASGFLFGLILPYRYYRTVRGTIRRRKQDRGTKA